MVLDGAREEADCMHSDSPGNLVKAAAQVTVPTLDPGWNVNNGDRPKLEHYRDFILDGLQK